ncbi:MAG TPA: YncE family protein [Opitutales bacterium]|nr:YncE family protein [Opitutales bacterium]
MKTPLLLLSIFTLAAAMHAADAPAAPAASASAAPGASGPYHFLKEIHLGGVPSTDYLTVDPEGRRLYVSHGNEVAVVDLEKDEVVGNVTGLSSVHGIAIAPKAGEGFISNRGSNAVSVFDLKTLKVTKTIPVGNNPDWIFYEPSQNEVYAFNGNSHTVSVIDVATGNVTATIDLPGKPESATADAKAGRVYDNIEDQKEVAVIDMKTHKVVATWKNDPADGASGQAIDLEHHRLFLGCGDDTLTMMDSTNGKVLFSLPAAKGIDSAAFDPGTGYAFVPGGQSGTVTVAKVDGDKLVLVQTLATAQGAKTMALDPTTHKFYTATVKYQAAPAAASGSATGARGRGPRPNAVPDSFRVLVYGLDEKK